MSIVEVIATCTCGSIGRRDLRQCPDHFHIYYGDKRLTSVGRVIRELWPKVDIPEAVLENARERGQQVDKFFAEYVRNTLTSIPAGTRMDVKNLFFKLKEWYDKSSIRKAEVQVLLGGQDFGGVVDFRFDDVLVDLKSTWDVLPTHELQVGGYLEIEAEMTGAGYLPGAILHVTERFKEPRLIPVDPGAATEWKMLRDAWSVINRRTQSKGQ